MEGVSSHRLAIAALCAASALTGCWTPRSVVALEKYVYGVQVFYQTPWDRLDELWRDATFLFRKCSDAHVGLPRPRSQRR